MTSTQQPAGSREDGRTVRGRRTQRAVVDAVLALVEEGNVRPTAEQVATRAGVSLRTVYQHFRDRESLFRTATEVQLERMASFLRVLPDDGPFAERRAAFLDQRIRLLEEMTPLRRAALLLEPFFEEARREITWARDAKRAEPLRVFGIELAKIPAAERPEAEAALGSATSWATWEGLRVHQGLPVQRARAVMERTIVAVLGER